jgi:type II secretory pathway component GspD/PulD (secretin)
VRYSDPAMIAEAVPALMPSTNGLSIQVIDRKLAVRGNAEQHAIVATIVREIDNPPRNVQINVKFASTGKSDSREAGIRPNGPIVIRDGELRGSIEGRFGNQNTTSRENTTQMLVAMDGHSAMLRVGESVPYLAWLTEYSWRHGYIREVNIEWRDVGSFLSVRPEILGDGPLIRVRLTPTLSGRLTNGTKHTIEFTELTTEVTVRDGQTLSIGGFNKDQEFSSKFLVGQSGGSETSITDITLTPRILN